MLRHRMRAGCARNANCSCYAACLPQCQAYVGSNLKVPPQVDMASLLLAAGLASLGAAAADGLALAGSCQVRNDTTISGSDILPDSARFSTVDPAGCCAACANNTACQYWTWYKHMSNQGPRCYLKRSAAGIKMTAHHQSPPSVVTGSGHGAWPPPKAPPAPPPVAPLPFDTEATIDVTHSATATPFDHYWKKSFGSGHASLTLRPDWQAHLKLATEQLGLTGVRHHGLLDDDMGVVIAPRTYNFSKVLSSWAYQRSLGVTPIVELSFMPAVLAGCSSRRRDCHSAAPPSPFSRRFNSDGEGLSSK